MKCMLLLHTNLLVHAKQPGHFAVIFPCGSKSNLVWDGVFHLFVWVFLFCFVLLGFFFFLEGGGGGGGGLCFVFCSFVIHEDRAQQQ